MVSRGNSRTRIRTILTLIILGSLSCYCLGMVVLQVNQARQRTPVPTISPTSTPSPVSTTVAPGPVTQVPFFITNTPSLTPTVTITWTPSITPTQFVPPTKSPTIAPTITETFTPEPVLPSYTPSMIPATPIIIQPSQESPTPEN